VILYYVTFKHPLSHSNHYRFCEKTRAMVSKQTHDLLVFGGYFWRYVFFVRHLLVGLLLMITVGGIAVSYVEGLRIGDGVYFAFVTGLTIGYGDISAVTALGRILSIAIGVIGMLFTGITIAIATRALADAINEERIKDESSPLLP
jgi:voltage-gated potassium channel